MGKRGVIGRWGSDTSDNSDPTDAVIGSGFRLMLSLTLLNSFFSVA